MVCRKIWERDGWMVREGEGLNNNENVEAGTLILILLPQAVGASIRILEKCTNL